MDPTSQVAVSFPLSSGSQMRSVGKQSGIERYVVFQGFLKFLQVGVLAIS